MIEQAQGWSRRQWLSISAGLGLAAGAGSGWAAPDAAANKAGAWPAWEGFCSRFVSDTGRVSANDKGQTYSEAQSYAMFFALVANDRERFEALTRWTENNLCAGDLTARLPAWLWGKREDGTWTVIDDNAASDADLWIAYALAEAGRLWKVPRYQALAATLAERIVREETADLPQLGPMLLPGPKGFALPQERWRINPSYTPLQVLRLLETVTGQPVWRKLAQSAQRAMIESAPRGFSPDWTVYDASQGFVPDTRPDKQGQGGYNAIRVYLWAGMLHPQAWGREALLKALRPMALFVRDKGFPPESIDIATGQHEGVAPVGFSAALLPFLQASGASDALRVQQLRLQAREPRADAYYEQCMVLFGQGFMEQAYRFAADGRLLPRWGGRS
ncbi:cellulose synthase complex periplasmic endoglucanase BcsZ [Melaminivora sp.]